MTTICFIKKPSTVIQMIKANAIYSEKAHDQCIVVKMFNLFATFQDHFVISANEIIKGNIPKMIRRMIPGMKKLLKGEFSSKVIDILIKPPLGSITNTNPPKTAPVPKRTCKKIRNLQLKGFLLVIFSTPISSSHHYFIYDKSA